MNHCSQQKSIALRRAWIFLLFVALPAALLPAKAKRTRTARAALSIDAFSPMTSSDKRNRKDSLAFLVSVPRGGTEETAKSTVTAQGDKGDKDSEEEADVADEESDSEEEELVEEGAEETVETIEAEDASVGEDVIEEEAVVAEEEDEEDGVVVFPTEEIPSDDVRSFHTTDGELADDEGFYTDGQNESSMADNEAAADTIGETEAPADSGSDDNDGNQQDDDPSTEATTAMRTASSVTAMDDALKEVLMADFRYTKDDVSRMRPEIAVDVVRNKLMRPYEGMPKNWYMDPTDFSKKQSFLAKKKRLVVSIAIVGAAALSVGVLKENDTVGDTIEEIVDAIQAIPRSLVGAVVAAKNAAKRRIAPKSKQRTPAAPAVARKSETKEEFTEEKETGDEPETTDTSIHSIKPGTSPEEVPDLEADYTWLDKMITRVGGLVKSFFNIKI